MPAFSMALGQWNVTCSMCGISRKSSELVKNWQGQWRCPRHNEPRHPQDFVRPIGPETVPAFNQNPDDVDIEVCDTVEISAIAGGAVAGCAIAGYVHPAAREILAARDAAEAATHTWPL
jgi:hypothetical protein